MESDEEIPSTKNRFSVFLSPINACTAKLGPYVDGQVKREFGELISTLHRPSTLSQLVTDSS